MTVPTSARGAPAWLTSPAARLVGKRLLMAVPIVIGVSILTFWVLNPGVRKFARD